MKKIYKTTICKWCHGKYEPNGWCPKYGLKFPNGPCCLGATPVEYKLIRVRNNNPFWKFWHLYDYESRIISKLEEAIY